MFVDEGWITYDGMVGLCPLPRFLRVPDVSSFVLLGSSYICRLFPRPQSTLRSLPTDESCVDGFADFSSANGEDFLFINQCITGMLMNVECYPALDKSLWGFSIPYTNNDEGNICTLQ